jgi:hypothetical protein
MHLEIIGTMLRSGADVAEITTGTIALIVGGRYLWLVRLRRLALEKYLKAERRIDEASGSEDRGSRSVMHLMGYVAMTESEVLDAAFTSRNIKSFTTNDPKTGRANALLFQFENRKNSAKKGAGK